MLRSIRIVSVLAALVGLSGRAAGGEDGAALLALSGVKGGLVVHLGCGDGELTAALRAGEAYVVHGLDASAANVARARERWQAAGCYGPVSFAQCDGSRLPYADHLVNLLVVSEAGPVTEAEMLRVLAPGGVLCVRGATGWVRRAKPWPEDMDEWGHFLHGPDNNAVARDRRAGVPRSLQWVAGPRWGRSHEELASMSAAVTAGGRMYCIEDEAPLASIRYRGQWWLVARDAFNGILLWKRPIPVWTDHLRHFRSGPAHLPRRLVAAGDTLYATRGLDGPVLALDGASGAILRTYGDTERTEEILHHEGMLFLVRGTSEADRRGGGLHGRDEPEPASFQQIAAIDAATGQAAWREDVTADGILPLSLAVKGERLFYQSRTALVGREARTGREIWRTPRPTPARRMGFSAPTLVATDAVVLCADRSVAAPKEEAATGDRPVQWAVHGWSEPGFARNGASTLVAYDAASGRELWSAPCREGYNSPVDLFVVGSTVWVGPDYRGLDVRTGQQVGKVDTKAPKVGMAHHRCYRNKATEQFIFTGKSGVEVLSYDRGWLSNNSWVRGTCQFGIIPANGLVYAPPDACGCFLTVKAPGFVALAPQRHETPGLRLPAVPARVEGPAFGQIPESEAQPEDWPMYRHDARRSGTGTSAVPEFPALAWSVPVGDALTQPVVAHGAVYVADTHRHAVHALAAADGRRLWTYTAGGRIDSAPTFFAGRILFGSADGWIQALDARDGRLAWRFRAAPEDWLVGVDGQVESAWPVHGSVLVQNGAAYVLAGRSSYLDGGLVLYRLDPRTGEQLSRTVFCHLDPETGRQLVPEAGFDMEGTTSDLLSGDGEQIFLKHFAFSAEGERIASDRLRLFSITGFLGEEWFVRSYWTIASRVAGAGWGGWANTANQFQAGRILCLADAMVYGYGREQVASAAAGHRLDTYHLFAASVLGTPALDRKGERRTRRARPVWADRESITVRAMVLGGGRLAVAGPPDLGRKDRELMAYRNEEETLAAFRGDKGGVLRVVRASDGRRIAETALPSVPVFDGMCLAGGRLYLADRSGGVSCFLPGTGTPLPDAVAVLPPVQEPLPPQGPEPNGRPAAPAGTMPKLDGADRRAEFDRVEAAAFVAAPLGYRLAAEKGKPAFAIRRLDAPLEQRIRLAARMRPAADGRLPGYYENAYIAFGDGPGDDRLVKCGLKFILGEAVILTGPATGGHVASVKTIADRGEDPEVRVEVDLMAGTVEIEIAGKKAKASLPADLKKVTHVGYCLHNAISDFGPIAVQAP